jgi:hypothetical protein
VEAMAGDPDALRHAVLESCRLKAARGRGG